MRTDTAVPTTPSTPTTDTPRGLLRRHPVGIFLTVVITLTWALQMAFLAAGQDLMPALLIELVLLLGGATFITARVDGRPGVRRLYRGLLVWRVGVLRWIVLVAAMPVLTLAVAAATGTLQDPAGGWPKLVATYLFSALIFGALLGNLWEETAWSGFVQNRLMDRRGLLIGSLLTAVPFFLIHIPFAFATHGLRDTTWREAALDLGLLALAAPFLRYLIGTVLVDTRGSVLAVAVLHGGFNAAGALAAVDGGWQYVPAMVVLTLLVIAYRAWRRRSAVDGTSASGPQPA